MSATVEASAKLERRVAAKVTYASTEVRGAIWRGVIIILLFFGGLGSWSIFADLTGAVMSHGFVKVEGNRQTVQHLEGGVVKELLVREGDEVTRGQVLLRLDGTSARAMVEVLTSQVRQFGALRSRLLAERLGLPAVQFDPDLLAAASQSPEVAALIKTQKDVFEARSSALNNQIALLQQRIAQLDAQGRGTRGQIASNDRQVELIEDELTGTRELYEKGFATKTRVLALERALASLEGSRYEQFSQVQRIGENQGEIRLQIAQLRKNQTSEVTEQLREVETKLAEAVPRLRAAEDTLSRIELKAPETGTVIGLTAFTEGGIISPREHVMDIVPSDSELVVEVQVRPEDIADVKPGLVAEVKFPSFKLRDAQIVHGTVARVAADRMIDPRTALGFYMVQLRLNIDDLRANPELHLKPGLPAEVVLPLHARSPLQYLMGPLVAGMGMAFREK
jgi:HlyD family type I secretion membrane fusion protein